MALLDIVILRQEWGNLFLGGVADVGVYKGPNVDTFALGPTVGAVLKKGRWTYGFLKICSAPMTLRPRRFSRSWPALSARK